MKVAAGRGMKVDRLVDVRTVIAHGREEGPCADGLVAALIVKDVLPRVAIRFVSNGSVELRELAAEPGLLFVDIAPPAARVGEFLAAGALVLDHHASARELVAMFRDRGAGAYSAEPGVSAALLAFREVWEPIKFKLWEPSSSGLGRSHALRVAELVGIHDTHLTEDPSWDEARRLVAVLFFYEDWLVIDQPLLALRRRLELGPTLVEKQRASVARAVAQSGRLTTPKGTSVAVVPTTYLISDVVDAVDVDVVVGFAFAVRAGVPSMKLSFRSRRGRYNVREIAEALGGGGHDAAASVWIELHASHRHPYATIRTLMEMW